MPPITDTAATSFSGSYGIFLYTAGFSVSGEGLVSISTWPSGGAFATFSTASMPAAPTRFSTITGWPRLVDRRSCIARAIRSAVLPTGQGMMMPTGRVANDCACAAALIASSTQSSKPLMPPPSREEQPAVDVDRLAGDVRGGVAREISHHCGDLFGLALPPEWRIEALGMRRHRARIRVARGIDRPGLS